MADFSTAFQMVKANEGGYVNDPDDPGGETYKGVSRNNFSKWSGWTTIDNLKQQAGFPSSLDNDSDLQKAVSDFYRLNFWNKVNGDQISNQDIANSIFDFAVNAGITTSTSMAQKVIGVTTDGVIGPDSISGLNKFNPEYFISAFTVAKIAHFISIVRKRPTSQKYFYGWVTRAIGESA